MPTGCEDYDDWIRLSGIENRREEIRMLEARFAEGPTTDEKIVYAVAPRFNWDLPMVWTARAIAHFMGGARDGDNRNHEETR